MQLRELIRKCGLNDINVKGSEREVVLSTVFGLILAGTVYYLIFRKRRKPKDDLGMNENLEAELVEFTGGITKKRLIQILEQLLGETDGILSDLAKLEVQIRKEIKSAGTEIPEEEIKSFLYEEFKNNILAARDIIYTNNSCTEEHIVAAAEIYADCESVKQINSQMDYIGEQVKTGNYHTLDDVESTTSTLSADASNSLDALYNPRAHSLEYQHFLTILEETFEGMNKAMEETCKELKEANTPPEQVVQVLHLKYEEKANQSAKEALSNNGITEEEFETAISYFNHKEPSFPAKMEALQHNQMRRFEAATNAAGFQSS